MQKDNAPHVIELIEAFVDSINTAQSNAANEYGLDLQRAKVLMVLFESGYLRQVEVGEKAKIAQYTISRMVDSLENNGYLHRMNDPDSRRCHLLELTELGHSTAHQLCILRGEISQKLLANLASSEREVLSHLLQKAIKVCK